MKPFKEAEGYYEDLQAAFDYYNAYGAATAGRFLSAYEKAVETIRYSPCICRARRHGWRQMIIRDYPNHILFLTAVMARSFATGGAIECADRDIESDCGVGLELSYSNVNPTMSPAAESGAITSSNRPGSTTHRPSALQLPRSWAARLKEISFASPGWSVTR